MQLTILQEQVKVYTRKPSLDRSGGSWNISQPLGQQWRTSGAKISFRVYLFLFAMAEFIPSSLRGDNHNV